MRPTSMVEATLRAITRLAGALVFAALLPGSVESQQVPSVEALREEISKAGGRVIVGIKPSNAAQGMAAPGVRSLSTAQVQVIADRLSVLGLRVTRNYRLITAVAGTISVDGIEALAKDPNVEYIVPDRIHTLQLDSGPSSPADALLVETVPWGISKINAPSAWTATVPANYGAGVKVGILDTGGDFNHEDLAFAGGFDAILNSTTPADWDDNLDSCGGHGTHVAGIVGAVRGNNLGHVGVAPSASVYAIQVFVEYIDPFGGIQCGAFTSDVIAGVQWAAGNGMQVLNMSLGCQCFDPAEHAAYQAARAAGVHLVAAAGNSDFPTSGFSPAAYPEVIAVSATDINDLRASFSNFGPEVFVAAPGVAVPSTTPGNTYTSYNGTSQASPHVAGMVALLLAADPSLSNASIRGLLGVGAIDLGSVGRDDFFGEGRIDALNSINRMSQQPTPATQLALIQQPGSGTSGQPLVPAPEVELRDAQNQPVQQAGVIVTATISSGPGQITGLGTTQRTKARSGGGPAQIQTVAGVTDAAGRAVFSSLTVNTILSANHQLVFSAGNLTPVVSSPFSVTGSVTTLTNALPVTGLSGATGSVRYFVINVPTGQAQLTVATSGGSGDADLFVRQGVPPTLGSFDCVSSATDNTEACTILNPAPGEWYILEYGYAAYSGMTLTATFAAAGLASQLTIARQPGGAYSGVPFAQQPIIQLADVQGLPVALAGVPVTATVFSGPGVISGSSVGTLGQAPGKRGPITVQVSTAITDAAGTATFTSLTIAGTGQHVLDFSAPALASVQSQPFTVAAARVATPVQKNVPVTNLAGGLNSIADFVLTVPAGAANLTVQTSGGTGDVDLFVQLGVLPDTIANVDCASQSFTNTELCLIPAPAAGSWYVTLFGYAAYSGVTLVADYTTLAGATQILITQQPAGAVSGLPFTQQPTVQLADAQGQPVALVGISVTAAILTGTGTLTGTTVVTTAANGTATFTSLALAPAGAYTLTFTAPNLTAATSGGLTVLDPLAISTASPLPAGAVAVPYNQTLAAGGGTGPYTWSVISGGLPPGLALAAATGALSGTPTGAGAFAFIAQVSDAGARTAQKDFTLRIAGVPAVVVTNMVTALTGGPALSAAETSLYNCNASAGVDVGDLLCYLDANPSVSLTAEQLAAISDLMASEGSDAGTDDLKRRKD